MLSPPVCQLTSKVSEVHSVRWMPSGSKSFTSRTCSRLVRWSPALCSAAVVTSAGRRPAPQALPQ